MTFVCLFVQFLFSLEEEWFGATHPGVGWQLTLPAALIVLGVILLWRTVLAVNFLYYYHVTTIFIHFNYLWK